MMRLPDEELTVSEHSELASATTDLHRASVFRRCTWHHCATVAAAQRPFYFCVLVIASHTHASRVTNSRSVTFPGYRVACSAVGATPVVSRHSSVRPAVTSPLLPSSARTVLYYYFDIFRLIKFRRVINFPLALSSLIRDNNIPNRRWQVRLSSTVHDNIGKYHTSVVHYAFTP